MNRKRIGFALSLAMILAAGSLCAAPVSIELFSNKPESIQTLQGLIDAFQKQNPDIQVSLTAPPDAETVLKTRLAKDKLPDVFALGGNATYGELAQAKVFADLGSTKAAKNVQAAYLDMLARLVGGNDKTVYGIPYATNANGVIYNKDKFKALGLKVPTTWTEFVALLDKAKKAGETPIYFTLQDAWTGLIPWNSLSSNLIAKDFPARETAGTTSFAKEYAEVATKIAKLAEYGHADNAGVGYNDGNIAFANGKSVLYLQGNWAIPDILKANPKVNIGVFAMPVSDDPAKNNLVSGVDVLLAVNATTKKADAAKKFVEFMTTKDIAQRYIDEQSAFSAVKGVLQQNPVVEGYKVNFEKGKLSSFADHYYPAGFDAASLVQAYLMDKDQAAFLAKMDSAWKTLVNR
jgi:raffinose/stachyose/melibiose transport system substrate-binding protein